MPDTPPAAPPSWTFRTRLRWPLRLAGLGLAAFAVGGLYVAAAMSGGVGIGLLVTLLFGGAFVSFVLGHPESVVFGATDLTLRHPLRMDRRIAYADVTRLGVQRLSAGKEDFAWDDYANAAEVDEAVRQLLDAGLIPAEAYDARAYRHQRAESRAGAVMVGAMVALEVLLHSSALPPAWHTAPWWVQVRVQLVVAFAIFGATYLALRLWWGRGA